MRREGAPSLLTCLPHAPCSFLPPMLYSCACYPSQSDYLIMYSTKQINTNFNISLGNYPLAVGSFVDFLKFPLFLISGLVVSCFLLVYLVGKSRSIGVRVVQILSSGPKTPVHLCLNFYIPNPIPNKKLLEINFCLLFTLMVIVYSTSAGGLSILTLETN